MTYGVNYVCRRRELTHGRGSETVSVLGDVPQELPRKRGGTERQQRHELYGELTVR